MPKVLFVSGIEIFPPLSGGQLRSSNLTISLSKNHQVQVYSFTGRKHDYLKNKCSGNNQISENLNEYTNRSMIWGLIQYIFYKLGLPPIWLTILLKFYTPNILKKMIHDSDIIILDFPFLYPIFNSDNHAKKILNTHNAEYKLYKNKIISNLVKKIEITSFRFAEKIIFCSETDCKQFHEAMYKNKSIVIPNGIDLEQYAKINENLNNKIKNELNITNGSNVFIFTGSKYGPNVDAVNKLISFVNSNRNFLENNKIVILIVGSVCDQITNENVLKITSKVESIIPYLQISQFALNNIDTGSGTNVKMFEYIASNLVILSTEFGTRGFNLSENDSYLKIDDNYLSSFKSALKLEDEIKKQMTLKAYKNNESVLDMKNHLKELI